jgi:hypothetical protein
VKDYLYRCEKDRKEERLMKWGISSLDELQKMKEKMDRAWHELFEENHGTQEWMEHWDENLAKFEGTKRTLQSRSKKGIKPVC